MDFAEIILTFRAIELDKSETKRNLDLEGLSTNEDWKTLSLALSPAITSEYRKKLNQQFPYTEDTKRSHRLSQLVQELEMWMVEDSAILLFEAENSLATIQAIKTLCGKDGLIEIHQIDEHSLSLAIKQKDKQLMKIHALIDNLETLTLITLDGMTLYSNGELIVQIPYLEAHGYQLIGSYLGYMAIDVYHADLIRRVKKSDPNRARVLIENPNTEYMKSIEMPLIWRNHFLKDTEKATNTPNDNAETMLKHLCSYGYDAIRDYTIDIVKVFIDEKGKRKRRG